MQNSDVNSFSGLILFFFSAYDNDNSLHALTVLQALGEVASCMVEIFQQRVSLL